MKLTMPGTGELVIKTVILDLNGTLSVGGEIVPGVQSKIEALRAKGLRIVLFTGNTRGDANEICASLGIEWKQAGGADDKRALALEMEPQTCAAIGNGLIDKELMETVALGILTLQAEGIHTQTLLVSDIIVPTIIDALDLLIDEQRLVATLRR